MLAVFTFLTLALSAMSATAQPVCTAERPAATALEEPALEAFTQRIVAYMEVHNRVERKLSLHWQFEDPEEMDDAIEAMQSAIRSARPDARRGAIFTEDVGSLIRGRLTARLIECNDTVEDVLAFINEERLPGVPKPTINEPFPWALGSAMWPSFLAVLPALPDELQYRFADRDLVLIDVHANLVVDILVKAIPAPRSGTRMRIRST